MKAKLRFLHSRETRSLRQAAAVLVVTALAGLSGCGLSEPNVAERCLLVDLQQEEGRQLLPYLESFGEAYEMHAEVGAVISQLMLRRDDGSRIDIVYRIGMAEFGAQLALFRSNKEASGELLAAFDGFVVNEVESRFSVRRCEDIPDYGIPAISG